MFSSRCFRSISKLSSTARLVRHASRLQQETCREGLILQSGLLGRSATSGQCLATQSKYGRRFTRNLYITTVACDLSRIPEILTNSVTDGAGVDSDIAEDDDEMSSPVKKAKHWRNPSY
ncbi:uncharacterized protein [Porites lutea]|uniref:uncharacterized protein n=1 Tax=Porites lutea TaxID=51062 RepID=UPI003CC5AD30